MLLLIVAACTGQPATKDSLALTDSETPPRESETALDTELPAGPGSVRINEVVSANRGSLNDADGDSPDWIELYNDSDEAVSLAGWGLSDDPDDPFAWTFPDTTLAARGFLVVFASGKDTSGPAGELHTDFKLSAEGELLSLTRGDGVPSDTLNIPALDDDQSYGLDEPVTTASLLGPGSAARAIGEPDGDWTLVSYEDSAWTAVTLPVGFDGTVSGGSPGEVANGASATQSTDGYGFFGSAAVDGDPSTFTHTADADLLPWWQVNLGANYAITRVELVNRFDCCAERLYNVVISVLDAEGEPVWASELLNPTLEGEIPTSPGRVLAVDLSAYGASVRVDKTAVNGAGSSEWLSLAEVAVTGTLASPYAGTIRSDVGGLMTGTRLGVRAGFTLAAAPTRLVLDIAYDDGFTAWLDGEPFAAGNAGAPIAHDGTTAEASFGPGAALGAGAHTLALLGENVSADDDDLLLDPTLTAEWFTGRPRVFQRADAGRAQRRRVRGLKRNAHLRPAARLLGQRPGRGHHLPQRGRHLAHHHHRGQPNPGQRDGHARGKPGVLRDPDGADLHHRHAARALYPGRLGGQRGGHPHLPVPRRRGAAAGGAGGFSRGLVEPTGGRLARRLRDGPGGGERPGDPAGASGGAAGDPDALHRDRRR
ncbi:MAG: hypothetical protein RIT28_1699 [Pseudomonadota bacterium]